MTLLLGGRLRKEPSERIVSALARAITGKAEWVEDITGPNKGTSYPKIVAPEGHAFLSGESVTCNIGDGGELFSTVYRILRENDNDLGHYNFHVLEDGKVFPEDRKQILGHVLEARDENSLSNPPNDYSEPPIRSCQVRLKLGVRPTLREKPKGLLIAAPSDGYIIHTELLSALKSNSLSGDEPVIHAGKVLKDWHRLRIVKRKDVIDDMTFMPKDCSLTCTCCGRPWVSSLREVWFAKSALPIHGLEVNLRGQNHYGEEPILLLSSDLMWKLKNAKLLQRANIWLANVYSKNTRRYEVVSMIRALMAKHGDPAAKHSPREVSAVDPAAVVKALGELDGFIKKALEKAT